MVCRGEEGERSSEFMRRDYTTFITTSGLSPSSYETKTTDRPQSEHNLWYSAIMRDTLIVFMVSVPKKTGENTGARYW